MPEKMVTVEIKKVQWLGNRTYEVVLENGGRRFSLYTGLCEGSAIVRLLRKEKTPHPVMHDLFLSTVKGLGGTIRSAVITEIKDEVFFGRLIIDQRLCDGGTFDCRPSDMIALALIAGVPIEIVESVFNEAINTPLLLTTNDGSYGDEKAVEFFAAMPNISHPLQLLKDVWGR